VSRASARSARLDIVSDDGSPRAWMVQVMNQVEGQVEFGDTKAGQLLATTSLLLAALLILAKDVRAEVSRLTLSLGVVASLFLAGSLALVLISIAPAQVLFARPKRNRIARVWSLVLRQPRSGGHSEQSVVHFASIAADDVDAFVARASNAPTMDIEYDILRAIHGKSQWARHKFRWLDRAVKLLLLSLVCLLAAAIVELMRWIE
jgi:hypothetical protein